MLERDKRFRVAQRPVETHQGIDGVRMLIDLELHGARDCLSLVIPNHLPRLRDTSLRDNDIDGVLRYIGHPLQNGFSGPCDINIRWCPPPPNTLRHAPRLCALAHCDPVQRCADFAFGSVSTLRLSVTLIISAGARTTTT